MCHANTQPYWVWAEEGPAQARFRRFRNFSFYPSIAPTGLVRAEDSLETETRFKEKGRKYEDLTVRKKEKIGERKKEQEANWRRLKKFRENWRK